MRELSVRGALRERFIDKVIVISKRQQRTFLSCREKHTGAKDTWENANVFRRQVDWGDELEPRDNRKQ